MESTYNVAFLLALPLEIVIMMLDAAKKWGVSLLGHVCLIEQIQYIIHTCMYTSTPTLTCYVIKH